MPGTAGRHDERVVIDLGVRVAESQRHHETVGDEEFTVEIEALANALVGVHQLHEVAAAADGRQLLVLDLVVEDGAVEPYAVAAELRLESDLDRLMVSESATDGAPKNATSRPWMVGARKPEARRP